MKGRTWHPSTIFKILSNPIYVGTAYYGRREAIEPKKRRVMRKWRNAKSSARFRPESEWIPITVPRILDDETFAKLQAISGRNREMLSGRPSMNYVLKGLVWCGRCGRKCRGHQNSGRPLYRCDHKDPVTFKRACWAGGVSAARLENKAWTALMDIASDMDLLRETMEKRHEEIFHAQDCTDHQRSELEEKLKAARRRESNLKEMTADAAPDAFAQIRGEWKLAQARRMELERQLAALLPAPNNSAISEHTLSQICDAFQKMREAATREERAEILQKLVTRINYADGLAEIEYYIPIKRYCLQHQCPENRH